MEVESTVIRWRLHLASPQEKVYAALSTDEGRARFWAEEAPLRTGRIRFRFPNGMSYSSRIVDEEPPRRYAVEYFGTVVTFELEPDGRGGTDLELTCRGVASDQREGFLPGWVSVLMSLKAAVDEGIDLRNHDPNRTWDQSYADN